MASRFSQSSVLVVPNHHLDDSAAITASSSSAFAANDDADSVAVTHRRDSEHAVASSSSTAAYANATTTTMAYLSQTVVLCELRHDAFEVVVPAGPSDSCLVSKWGWEFCSRLHLVCGLSQTLKGENSLLGYLEEARE